MLLQWPYALGYVSLPAWCCCRSAKLEVAFGLFLPAVALRFLWSMIAP